jgi:hypothetical protein
MRHGGDKEIIAALKPFEKTQVPLACDLATMDGRSIGRGERSWIDPNYESMLRKLAKVMRKLGYKGDATHVADAYMCGYVRGLHRGARAKAKS